MGAKRCFESMEANGGREHRDMSRSATAMIIDMGPTTCLREGGRTETIALRQRKPGRAMARGEVGARLAHSRCCIIE